MAITDITNTPIDIISSTAVNRGTERRLLMLDISKTGQLDTKVGDPNGTLHPFFELPAGAAIKRCYFWIVGTIVGDPTFSFFREGVDISGVSFTQKTIGAGGFFGILEAPDLSASATLGAYDPDASDLQLEVLGGSDAGFSAGKFVIEVNWVNVLNAVTAGYREGDGTV